ncbi:MAG: hypothetical protein LQ343_005291 [Gyalolechia ehrenbergii]|nr:MAG: hypothetical protein LQ343_005291 [Gyalolechia ehrenbergii]
MDTTSFSQLLALPTEIRLKVYEYVLCYDAIEPQIEWTGTVPWLLRADTAREEANHASPESTPRPSPITVRVDTLASLRDHRTIAESQPQRSWQMFAEKVYNPARPWIPLESVLGLHATCRQIYAESKGIFWSKNQFLLNSHWGISYFAHGLGHSRLRYISCIGIREPWSRYDSWAAEQATQSLPVCRISGFAGNGYAKSPLEEDLLIRSALEAATSHGPCHHCDSRLPSSRQRSITAGHMEISNDLTGECVVDCNGELRSSLDILAEAIKGYRLDQRRRMSKTRQRWRIEFERFPTSNTITWLTTKPKSKGGEL